MTLYAAWIAVCLAGVPRGDCTEATALYWMRAPELSRTPAECLAHGQAYAAASGLRIAGAYLTVTCAPHGRLARR